MGGGKYVKPGILYFNEDDVMNCFITKDGQLRNLNELYQLLERQSNSEDIEDIILSRLQKESKKYK